MKGERVPRDYRQAAHWYPAAVNKDLAIAQYNLGVYYEQDVGVRKDAAEALHR